MNYLVSKGEPFGFQGKIINALFLSLHHLVNHGMRWHGEMPCLCGTSCGSKDEVAISHYDQKGVHGSFNPFGLNGLSVGKI